MRLLFVTLWLAAMAAAGSPLRAADELDHTKWRLVSTEHAGDLNVGPRPATLLFEQGRYSIGGCNTMNGAYSVDGNRLQGTTGMSTQKACDPDAQAVDEALLKAITINHSFEVTGKELIVTDEDGGRFTFQTVPLPSRAAVTKFIYVAAETKGCAGAAPAKCLQVRETKDQPWSTYAGRIVGFTPVAGIEYRLRVKEVTLKNPPADRSKKIWYLDQIVEQKVVDPQAVHSAGAHATSPGKAK